MDRPSSASREWAPRHSDASPSCAATACAAFARSRDRRPGASALWPRLKGGYRRLLGIGLFGATWQFHAADNEAGGNAIASWFGEWLVYGLFAYVVFRFIPRTAPGVAIVLASLVVVGGVNYKSYAAINEERQALASLSRAAPFLNKMQTGAAVSDEELRAAHVGVLEPLLLAQAVYGREVAAVAEAYQKAIAQLAPEEMLLPGTLATASGRLQTRSRLKIWAEAAADYKSQIAAATARAKLGVQAAVRQMPEVYTLSTTSGFEESAAQLTAFVDRHIAMENEAGQAVTAILDLLDANPRGFVLDRGPPPNLLFRDEATLAAYRRHFNAVLEVGKRETENQARFNEMRHSQTQPSPTIFIVIDELYSSRTTTRKQGPTGIFSRKIPQLNF